MLYKGPENTNSPALLLAAAPTRQGTLGGLSSLTPSWRSSCALPLKKASVKIAQKLAKHRDKHIATKHATILDVLKSGFVSLT